MERALLGFSAKLAIFELDLACMLRAVTPAQRCPRCGTVMPDIKGSTFAVCRVCGYKDDCC